MTELSGKSASVGAFDDAGLAGPPGAPGVARSEGPPQLTVRYAMRRAVAYQAPLMAMILVMSAGRRLDGPPVRPIAITVLVLGFWAWLLVRMMRRPHVVVDAAGIRFPGLRVWLPWREVADVRPAPAKGLRPPLLLVVPRDPQAVLAQVGFLHRQAMRYSRRRVGTPLSITDVMADHTLGEIESAVRASQPRATGS